MKSISNLQIPLFEDVESQPRQYGVAILILQGKYGKNN